VPVPALLAELVAQALALRRVVPGTATTVTVSCRARTVLFQIVLVPTHRASAKWPPILIPRVTFVLIRVLLLDGGCRWHKMSTRCLQPYLVGCGSFNLVSCIVYSISGKKNLPFS
jgi:hypothetical protein